MVGLLSASQTCVPHSLLDDDVAEGSPKHVGATALRRYWIQYGFHEAAGDYLALVIGDDA